MIQFSDDAVAQRFFQMADDVATIKESLKEYPDVKEKVDKHETIVTFGKWLSVPVFAFLHVSLKQILTKLGWS